ncbi:MAG: SpoIIE family protein phosphatase [Candidatus Sumerlaeia bacterium]|nr:SpoIIE family protein phosphatase [Candidatus Sumerlaeia bacterium]
MPSSAPLAPPSPQDTPTPLPGGRILLVEDQLLLSRLLSRQLELQGHHVQTAKDGREALLRLTTFTPDLVISDWMMEGMDGIELCRRIRTDKRHADVYFILLTAKEKVEDRLTAFHAGIDEYIVKPVVDQELLERVRVGLRIITLQRDLGRVNAQLSASLEHIRHEFETIGGIQRSLLPSVLPHDHMDCELVYQPCDESGGDYYDFLRVDADTTAVVMADVSGHGAPAMVAMAIIRSLVHSLVPGSASPAEALGRINTALFSHLPTDQYATMFLGFWSHTRRALVYATAGHPLPLILRRGAVSPIELPRLIGFPIKLVEPNVTYDQAEVTLDPGDRFVLYTDGIIEAWNPRQEMYEKRRLLDVLSAHGRRPLPDLCQHILQSVLAFCEERPLEDDLTLVVAEVR